MRFSFLFFPFWGYTAALSPERGRNKSNLFYTTFFPFLPQEKQSGNPEKRGGLENVISVLLKGSEDSREND